MNAVFVDCTVELDRVLKRLSLDMPPYLKVHHGSPSEEELAGLCRDAEVLLVEHTVIPASVLAEAPALRAIIFMGTGASTYVPVEEAKRLGIEVVTTPGYANRAVAEHTMALLFSAARNVARMDREIRHGTWAPRGGRQLHGRKIAVLGLGHIGRTFADMAVALGMRVAGWNRAPVEVPYYVPELRMALEGADFVTLHLALTEHTEGLIDASCLELLSPGAILVNTARAQLVQTGVLQEALSNGQLSHAALDVFEEEPLPINHEWRGIDDVTLTAHAAYMTDDAYTELWSMTMAALRRFIF